MQQVEKEMDYSQNLDMDDGAERAPAALVSKALAEVFASLPEQGMVLLGKPAKPADVLEWAVKCGFDPRTGNGAFGSGAVLVDIKGVKHALFWREA